MHSAPSVTYPVARSRGAQRLLLAIWLLGAGAAALSCLQSGGAAWRQGLPVLAVLASGAACWIAFRRDSAGGTLNFNGRQWSLSGPGGVAGARLRLALDLQALLLVRLEARDARQRWIWLDRRSLPARWLDLRRAIHSRAAPEAILSADEAEADSRGSPASPRPQP